MPKLNAIGQGCGAWSTGLHVDGRLVWSSPTGGASDAGWLNDSLVIAQLFDQDGARVSMLDLLETPAVETVLWRNGATTVRAGGMRSAASASGRVQIQGRATVPYTLCDVSPEGVVVLSPAQSHDSLVVKLPSGDLAIPSGPLVDDSVSGPDVRLRGNILAYRSSTVVLWEVEQNRQILYAQITAQPVFLTVPLLLPSGLALLELGNGRLTLRPYLSTLGIVVATGDTFAPDAVLVETGDAVVVAWSTLAGEAPSACRSVTLPVATLFANAVELNAAPVGPVVPMPDVNRIVPLKATQYGGVFSFDNSEAARVSGNFSIPVRPSAAFIAAVNKAKRKLIVNDAAVEFQTANVLSYYCSDAAGDVPWTCEAMMDFLRPLAKARGVGVTANQDSFPVRQSVLDKLEDGDVLMVETYRGRGEAVDAFGERVWKQSDVLPNKPGLVVWLAGIHDWPNVSDAEHAEALIVLSQVCSNGEDLGIGIFARGRKDCPVSPALQPFIDRLFMNLVDDPQTWPTPKPKPPKPPVIDEDTMTLSQRAAYDAAMQMFGATTLSQQVRHSIPDMSAQAVQVGNRDAGPLTEDETAACLERLVQTKGDTSKARDLVWPPKA